MMHQFHENIDLGIDYYHILIDVKQIIIEYRLIYHIRIVQLSENINIIIIIILLILIIFQPSIFFYQQYDLVLVDIIGFVILDVDEMNRLLILHQY